MESVYQEIREMARAIASDFPEPSFYRELAAQHVTSRSFFETDTRVRMIHDRVCDVLADDFGHGMGHSRKVAIEAGTLVLVESVCLGLCETQTQRSLREAHCAGLLHDICRKEPDHAARGAEVAAVILQEYGFPEEAVQRICGAILRHEAFRACPDPASAKVSLLSGCLYDADKFRWGPDNFTHTVWAMLQCRSVPLEQFLQHYPDGVQGITKIRETFRTETGRCYGPEFIDTGLAIGAALYEALVRRYGKLL